MRRVLLVLSALALPFAFQACSCGTEPPVSGDGGSSSAEDAGPQDAGDNVDAGGDAGEPGEGMRFRAILNDPVFPEGQDRTLRVGLVWFDVLGDPECVPPGEPDAGSWDAGSLDAGTTDAGTTDAGTTDAGATDAGAIDAGTTDAGAIDAGAPPDAGPPPSPFPPTSSVPGADAVIGILGDSAVTGVMPFPAEPPREHIKPLDADGDPCTPIDDDAMRLAFYVPVVWEDLDEDGSLTDEDDVVGFVSPSGLPPRLHVAVYIEQFNPLIFPGSRNGWNLFAVGGGDPTVVERETEVQLLVNALPRLTGAVTARIVDADGDGLAVTAADTVAILYSDFAEGLAPGPVAALEASGGAQSAALLLPDAETVTDVPLLLDFVSVGLLVGFDDVNANQAYDPDPGPDTTLALSSLSCPPKAVYLFRRVPWLAKFNAYTNPQAGPIPRRGYNVGLLGEGLTLTDFDEPIELIDLSTAPVGDAGPEITCP